MKPTSTSAPPDFQLSRLIAGDTDCYEATVSRAIARSSKIELQAGRGDAYWLPSQTFLRDLGMAMPSSGSNLAGYGIAGVAAAARPQLVLEAIGAPRIEAQGTGAVTMPVWNADTSGSGWVSEGAAAGSLNTTVRAITATGRMACARLGMSRRMAIGARDIEAAVLAEVSASVAGTIEKGFIQGTNTGNEPMGLLSVPGTGSQSFAAASPTYGELVDQLEKYALADGDLGRAVWLMHPSMAASILKTEISSGSGQMLGVVAGEPRQALVMGIPAYTSRHVPTGKVILLDPSMLRLVYWGAPQLIVDRYSNGKSLSGNVEIIVLNLCDLAVIHPAHIVIGSN